MLKNIITLLTFLVAALPICEAQKPVIPDPVKATIHSRVDNGINTGIVVGVITSKGTTFYSYGVQSANGSETVNENSVFEIASISKTFTGILLSDLVVNEELTLNTSLQTLLPKGIHAPNMDGQAIELVHLANHTSSLPRMPLNFDMTRLETPFVNYSERMMYDFLDQYELKQAIGSQYEYSNYGLGLLGHVLAGKYDMNYEELLTERISKPLHFDNTSTLFKPHMKKHLAKGHKLGVEVANWDYLSNFAGAAGIRSNAKDMIKYLAYNMGIEQSELYPAMKLSHENSRNEGDQPMVGLGWQIVNRKEKEIIWHDGETSGYCSFAGFLKNGDKGVVVLTNSNVGVTDIGMHLLDPDFPLEQPKPFIGTKMKEIIRNEGMNKAKERYWELKEAQQEHYNFDENQLNTLGLLYLWEGEMVTALSLFELNCQAFPRSSNAYFKYGAALMQNNDTTKAIAAFRKSVELYPDHLYAIKNLQKLGVNTDSLLAKVVVEDAVLESYTGSYELFPDFILRVSKHGDQLKTQATGKPEYFIYPKSDHVFYFKVFEAEITFNTNEKGEVVSLTLVQGGERVVGPKLKEKDNEEKKTAANKI